MKLKKVYIEITNACNLSCSFCIQKHEQKRYLTLEQLEHILIQVKPITNYIYLHILGEPLSHPYLDEILCLTDRYEFYVQITTNGTLLNKNLPILLNHTIRQVNISVHSFSQQSQKVQETYLQDVLECGDRLSEKSYISYRLWCMNEQKLDQEATAIFHAILNHYQISKEEVFSHRNTLAKNCFISFDDVFEWPSLNHVFVSKEGTCRGLRDMIGILSNGDVVPCCLDAYSGCKLGNIFVNDLEEILMSEKVTAMIQGFQNHQLIEPLCQRCQYSIRFK